MRDPKLSPEQQLEALATKPPAPTAETPSVTEEVAQVPRTKPSPEEVRRAIFTADGDAPAIDALTTLGLDGLAARKALREFKGEQAEKHGTMLALPVEFDFDRAPAPPEWIVDRTIERGTVVILSGDTGSAKSIVTASLIPAALKGEDWLGKTTAIDRVTYIDEENPERLMRSRLRALGVDNSMRDRLRYFSRQGLAIADEGASDTWLRGHLAEFRPDLLVIDTLMAACAVEDTNSNSEAVRVMKHLRGLAREYECAVLLLHHERKQSKEHPSSSGQAMMGARQWAGQADGQMTLTVESDFIEEEADDGGLTTRRTFKFRPAEKDRDGRPNLPRRVAVESKKGATGGYEWMTVTDEGPLTVATAEGDAAGSILRALHELDGDQTSSRTALAAAAGEKDPKNPGGTFKRALKDEESAGRVESPSRGQYRLTDAGRATAPGLAV